MRHGPSLKALGVAIIVVIALILSASIGRADLIIYSGGQPYRLVSPGNNPSAYLPPTPRRDCDRDRGGNDNQLGWLVGGLLLGLFSNNQPSYSPGYGSPYQPSYGGNYGRNDPYASAYAESYQSQIQRLERNRRNQQLEQARQAGRAAAERAYYGGY